MRFEEACAGWQAGRLRQEEAARLLGVCERSFRRYIDRYEEAGLEGLIDRRMGQVSGRRAPVDEVLGVVELYRVRYAGWNVRHFHSWYVRAHGGARSYSWVKSTLQAAGAVQRAPGRGKHRKRRERSPMRGMMLHQDGSTHAWVADVQWDLIVTMDDANSEHTSMFFVEEEGSASSFHGIGQTIAAKGLFAMLYTDRASHYFHTPEAGGKVDKRPLTQVGWRSWASSISRLTRPRHGDARSGPFAPTRRACPGNWRWPASATSRRPTAIWSTSTAPLTTPSSRYRPPSSAAPTCPTSVPRWLTSCASSSSAPWGAITA